ncbi:MAG: PAS domain-containing sensor histidine kinase [Candidatus Marinimicrobia bacterium]|nr:PAS domain-containing sensor histidine kinase [Candidatus Neomarinimicrobiota bacterium]MCF7850555.1 PAS domain-containing sensor histidine kinase [Candidatus Neomarinimicrobiota bacterium]MCF7904129.1 PAS domain-containing sensor histidine kinase [Candidatus Neomarinimicrobiota bacterium]
MLGHENPVDLLDSAVSDLVHESRRGISHDLEISMLNENEGLTSIEEVYIRKDGSPISVEISVYPIIFREENAVQIIARDITERKKVEAEIWEYQNMLKRVASDLILAEESERRKLAIVLHDQLGQSLAMAKIKISGLMSTLDGVEQQDKLKAIEADISAAVKQTRSLTNDLSPPVLHELGLIVAIRWRLDKFMNETGISTKYDHNVDTVTLRDEQSIILFGSADEILNNIVKHANAGQVNVMVDVQSSSLILMISDDGQGFDLSILNPENRRNDSFGLFSIKERLEYLGGVLDVQSQPKQGTRVILSIPISSGGA